MKTKQYTHTILALLTALTISGCATSQSPKTANNVVHPDNLTPAYLENVKAGGTVAICSGQPVPSGWVVVSWSNSMSCPGWTPGGMNVMNIKRPGQQETVCSGSPVPNGYVVVDTANSMSCPGWTPGGENQKIIRRL